MNRTASALAAAACVVFLGSAAACGSTSPAPQPAPTATETPVAVVQPVMARDIARQLGASDFTSKEVGSGAVLWGMTSFGTCHIKGEKFAINTFVSRSARDKWLKEVRQFGVVPRWMTTNSVTYPSVMP